MKLELGLQLLLHMLAASTKIFTALYEERLRYLKQQQAQEIHKFNSHIRSAKLQRHLDVQRWGFAQKTSLQQQESRLQPGNTINYFLALTHEGHNLKSGNEDKTIQN